MNLISRLVQFFSLLEDIVLIVLCFDVQRVLQEKLKEGPL
jgi:hypothetical protein